MQAYLIHLATLGSIYAMMALSFNFVVGYAGLVNFGHIGLMGIGAYTSAILTKLYAVPFPLALLAAALLTMGVAALLALPARTLKGDYYALVTLGFLFVANSVFINFESLTRGTLGIAGIPRPEGFTSPEAFFLLSFAAAVIMFLLLDRTAASPFGRVLEAMRDDEDVAASLGKPIGKLRVVALMISGACVGVAGAFLAHFIQFIAPNTFWLDLLVWALSAMMIGGIASMRGTLLGVALLFLITEPLRFLAISSALVGPLRLIVFMLALLALILFRPKGIMGRAQLEQ